MNRSPRMVAKIVTMAVKNVIVETWQPRPPVLSSKRSEPKAQMPLYRTGVKSGKALERRSLGKGRHVEDCSDVSIVIVPDAVVSLCSYLKAQQAGNVDANDKTRHKQD